MKKVISMIILIVCSLVLYFLINDRSYSMATNNKTRNFTMEEISTEAVKNHPLLYNGSLWKLMNRNTEEIIEQLGEPTRKDKSYYGYKWWVYLTEDRIIQVAIEKNRVVSIFGMGKDADFAPFQLGDNYADIEKNSDIKAQIELESYRFQLTSEDMHTRPLLQIDENIFALLYFNVETKQLQSIRLMSLPLLLVLRPYELYYSGDLPDSPTLKEDEKKEIYTQIEQQIFDITNVLRKNMGKQKLKWNEKAALAARNHSEDMYENNYFSHYAEDGSNLRNRLNRVDATYLSAGENIAAQYPDAISAVHGWLNSPGHREALLNEEYTHLGVGVYDFYYTQNFLKQ